jgi:FkbM family methyltransferase
MLSSIILALDSREVQRATGPSPMHSRLRRRLGRLYAIGKRLTPHWLRNMLPMKLRGVAPLSWVLIDALSRERATLTFVQIGANDGVRYDPLRSFILRDRWRGLFVEPLPKYFEALRKNHHGAGERLRFERAAVTESDGVLDLFRVDTSTETLPDWVEGVASFSREILLTHQHVHPRFPELIVKETVPALTVQSLLAKHRLGRVDLFCVDTEGHDYQIVTQILALPDTPDLIIVEHAHMTAGQRRDLDAAFAAKGLSVAHGDGDTVAFRPSLADLHLTDVLPFAFLKS